MYLLSTYHIYSISFPASHFFPQVALYNNRWKRRSSVEYIEVEETRGQLGGSSLWLSTEVQIGKLFKYGNT